MSKPGNLGIYYGMLGTGDIDAVNKMLNSLELYTEQIGYFFVRKRNFPNHGCQFFVLADPQVIELISEWVFDGWKVGPNLFRYTTIKMRSTIWIRTPEGCVD